MIKSLSILIPNFNNVCTDLVRGLQEQAEALSLNGLWYEIIVADDGSTDAATVETNKVINTYPHCSYIINKENRGRAAIRNFLAEKGRGEWVLFVDSDLFLCSDRYLQDYVEHEGQLVVYGGTQIGGDPHALRGNLRHLYEKKAEPSHTAVHRRKRPWRELSVCNCLMRRDVILAHPFDNRFKMYGYEDVLLGKRLAEAGVEIGHTDNPLRIDTFETNAEFIHKSEEALQTVVTFADELRGYSNIANAAARITRLVPAALIRVIHRVIHTFELRNLCGDHPSLTLFKLYKLGYFLSVKKG